MIPGRVHICRSARGNVIDLCALLTSPRQDNGRGAVGRAPTQRPDLAILEGSFLHVAVGKRMTH